MPSAYSASLAGIGHWITEISNILLLDANSDVDHRIVRTMDVNHVDRHRKARYVNHDDL